MSAPPGPDDGSPQRLVVNVSDSSYSPSSLKAKAGSPVQLVAPHRQHLRLHPVHRRPQSRVDGTVVGAHHGFRGPNSVDYRYVFRGREFAGHIGASEFYEVGGGVDVYVDPQQPSRSTLPDEQPQSGLTFWVTIFAIVLGFSGLGAGGWSLHLWRRRRRVLRTSGKSGP